MTSTVHSDLFMTEAGLPASRRVCRVLMDVDTADLDEVFALAGELGWGCRDRGAVTGSLVRRRIAVTLPVGGSAFGAAGRAAREVNIRLGRRDLDYWISGSEVLRVRRPLKPGVPSYKLGAADGVTTWEKVRRRFGASDLVFAVDLPRNAAEQTPGEDALEEERRRDRQITFAVGAALTVVSVVALIVLLVNAPWSPTFVRLVVLTALAAGSLPGIRRFLQSGKRAKVVVAALPLAFPLVLPATIALGNARVNSYLDHFGLSGGDLGVGSGLSYFAAALPVAVAVATSMMVIGFFGYISYFTGDDGQSMLPALMLGVSIVAYVTTSIGAAVNLGNREGAAAVADVHAGRGMPSLENVSPELACVTPLKVPIATRGASLPTDHPVYVFSSQRAALVATWDPATGRATWVAPSDVSVITVGSAKQACPAG